MQSEYRAFWKNKMWEVMQIDYRIPQTVIITDGITDHINVPLTEVVLMKNSGKQDISGEFIMREILLKVIKAHGYWIF